MKLWLPSLRFRNLGSPDLKNNSVGFHATENMGKDIKIKLFGASETEYCNYSNSLVAAILKFWQPSWKIRFSGLVNDSVELFDPENIGVEIRIRMLGGSLIEI